MEEWMILALQEEEEIRDALEREWEEAEYELYGSRRPYLPELRECGEYGATQRLSYDPDYGCYYRSLRTDEEKYPWL